MRSILNLRGMSRFTPLALTLAALTPSFLHAQAPDWTPVQSAFHANGVVLAGPVLHYDLVRHDLAITVADKPVYPATVANGYVNFKQLSGSTYFTDGSLPALESEVPALEAALRKDKNISIAAVVNHAALESPKLLWVHFESTGDEANLASLVASALAVIKDPQENTTAIPVKVTELPAKYQPIFGSLKGTISQIDGAIYEVVVARPDESKYFLGAIPASPALGVGITFYIQPTSGDNAIVNAEFALKQTELPPVIDALRASGFTVPAVHDHYVDDHNRLYYVHGFARGDLGTLGTALEKSLSTVYSSVQ